MRIEESDREIPIEYERLIGSKLGIVQSLNLWYPERSGPEVYSAGVRSTDVSTLCREEMKKLQAGGKGVTAREALRTVIGETAERYCSRWPDEDRIERATYVELEARDEVMEFEYLDVLPSEKSENIYPFDEETPLLWTPGTNLLTGETTYVPSQLVWDPYGPLNDEPSYFVGTSNGASAGSNLRNALVGGLYEAIERDGFMRTWHKQSPPRKIDPTRVSELRRLANDLFPSEQFSPHVFAFDSKVDVPTYGAALVNEVNEYPKFILGAGAAAKPMEAIETALVETGQGWVRINEKKTESRDVSIDDDIWNFEDNAYLYADPENFDEVSFLVEGTQGPVRQDGFDDELSEVLNRLEAAECTPIAVETTTPDVIETGIRTVTVIVPELLPLLPPAIPPEHHPEAESLCMSTVPHPFP